jgi:ribonuclease P protein component
LGKSKHFHYLPKIALSEHFAIQSNIKLHHTQDVREVCRFSLVFVLPKKYAKSAVRRNGIRRLVNQIVFSSKSFKPSVNQKICVQSNTTACSGKVKEEKLLFLIRLRKAFNQESYISSWSNKMKQDIYSELYPILSNLCGKS